MKTYRKMKAGDAEVILVAQASTFLFQFLVPSITAMKALHAAFMEKTRGKWNSLSIRVVERVNYKRKKTRLSSGQWEIVYFHPSFLPTWSGENFLLLNTENACPPAFFPRLTASLDLPLDQSWNEGEKARLWEMGLEGKSVIKRTSRWGGRVDCSIQEIAPIKPISQDEGIGIYVWEVRTSGEENLDAWTRIIKTMYGIPDPDPILMEE